MNRIKLDILGLSSSQSQSGSFALVLGESNGNRRLPIIIGMFEAQAIAIEIEKIVPNRPMTHDLFKSLAKSFNFTVIEVFISSLREGVFFSKIVCNDGEKNISIDARPSDAIAIGVRFNAPIYTTEAILNESGIEISEEEEETDEAQATELAESDSQDETKDKRLIEKIPSDKSKLSSYSTKQLQSMMDTAISNEDYELAAQLRDEVNKRTT